ncbi:F-box and WD repeat domain containing 4-like [Planoprotostelium fungivorum]|uniref:F-box and WD repeat domain containing 4-like n=1 Tax=Planoprotostelium fungivorum TaxID=1890364 RepID=A0A2P6N5M9_9EUKA|nr:F-box and WD repeat domain containing 4-like [Planoprotostelium fungivorum]
MSGLLDLPDDLLRNIIIHLNPRYLVHVLQTCRRMYYVTDNQAFWKRLYAHWLLKEEKSLLERLNQLSLLLEEDRICESEVTWRDRFRLRWWLPPWTMLKHEDIILDDEDRTCRLPKEYTPLSRSVRLNDDIQAEGLYHFEFEVERGPYHVVLGIRHPTPADQQVQLGEHVDDHITSMFATDGRHYGIDGGTPIPRINWDTSSIGISVRISKTNWYNPRESTISLKISRLDDHPFIFQSVEYPFVMDHLHLFAGLFGGGNRVSLIRAWRPLAAIRASPHSFFTAHQAPWWKKAISSLYRTVAP